MEHDHSSPPSGFCAHELEPDLLALIAPICAAARLQIRALDEPAATLQQPKAVFYSLAHCPEEPPAAPAYLVGRSNQTAALYERAAGTDLHVAILPEAQDWLLSVLSAETIGPAATITVIAASTGGAGASTVAALTALRAAQAGHRTLLIDGTATPTPHVGIGAVLPTETRPSDGWDQVLHMPDLPSVSVLEDHISQYDFDLGSLRWVVAKTARQTLPLFQLKAFLQRYRRHFEQIIVDAGTPDRGGRLPAERHFLVSGMHAQADAACYFMDAEKVNWQVVLNGTSAPGWNPVRCAQLSAQPVIGRVRKLRIGRVDTAKLARAKSLAFLDAEPPVSPPVAEPERQETQRPEVSASPRRATATSPSGLHSPPKPRSSRERPWLPELPAPRLRDALFGGKGRRL